MTTTPELLMLKGMISELSDVEQTNIKNAYAELKAVIEKHGGHGYMAFAQIGMEFAEQGDKP